MDIIKNTDRVIKEIKKNKPRIIGIDGIDGVGKTSFAKKLENFSYVRFSLDRYLQRKSREYFNFINFKNLTDDIKKAPSSNIVIEGVLLLKVLEEINISLNYLIYMTNRVWIYNWLKEWGQYATMDLDKIIKEEEKITNKVALATERQPKVYKMGSFRKEIYTYSYNYRSWEKADVVLEI